MIKLPHMRKNNRPPNQPLLEKPAGRVSIPNPMNALTIFTVALETVSYPLVVSFSKDAG